MLQARSGQHLRSRPWASRVSPGVIGIRKETLADHEYFEDRKIMTGSEVTIN
jgi:hypothetical protein